MRRIVPAFCAIVMLTAFKAPTFAAEVTIGAIDFGICLTEDGKELVPWHGDIPPTTIRFSEGQRPTSECLRVIDRKIEHCSRSTDLSAGYRDRRNNKHYSVTSYPGCRQIFRTTERECTEFYERERKRWCHSQAVAREEGVQDLRKAGDRESWEEVVIEGDPKRRDAAGNQEAAPDTGSRETAGYREASPDTESREAAPDTGSREAAGNQEAAPDTTSREAAGNQEAAPDTTSRETASYTESQEAAGDTASRETVGDCSAINLTSHEHSAAPVSCKGSVMNGKAQGKWVVRFPDGHTHAGSYEDGMMQGHWDGSHHEGSYVDDKRHGIWIVRYSNGIVGKGPYVNDKAHGSWTYRDSDGTVTETLYFNGKREGNSVTRKSNGEIYGGLYENNKKHGRWTRRFPDGRCNSHEWSDGVQVKGSAKKC